MLHFPFADEIADSPCDILYRNIRVDAVLVEQVDGVDPKATERFIHRVPNALWPAGDPMILARFRIDVEPELGRDHRTVAERAQRFADHHLVGERAIDFGGVEEGYPTLDRVADQPHAVLLRKACPVTLANAHAAKADRRHF